MKTIQIISGVSILYFLTQIGISDNEKAKVIALMGVIIMMLIFVIASHLYGLKNDIANEIKENHKRNIAPSVPSNSVTYKTDVPSTLTK